jgi:hypothetical protein
VDGFVRTLDAIRLECWTGSDQNAGRHHLRTPGRLPLESAGFAPKIGEPPANDGLVIVFLRHVIFSLLRLSAAFDGADAPASCDMKRRSF